jgi:hypothetical protein
MPTTDFLCDDEKTVPGLVGSKWFYTGLVKTERDLMNDAVKIINYNQRGVLNDESLT